MYIRSVSVSANSNGLIYQTYFENLKSSDYRGFLIAVANRKSISCTCIYTYIRTYKLRSNRY